MAVEDTDPSHDRTLRDRFTGKLNKLTLKIDRPKLTPADEKKLMEAQRDNKVSE